MAETVSRWHRWVLVLVIAAVLAAHALALRAASSRMALPAVLLLLAAVVVKHLGIGAVVRAWWRQRMRR